MSSKLNSFNFKPFIITLFLLNLPVLFAEKQQVILCDFKLNSSKTYMMISEKKSADGKGYVSTLKVFVHINKKPMVLFQTSHRGQHNNNLQAIAHDLDNDGIDEIFIGKVSYTKSKSKNIIECYKFDTPTKKLVLSSTLNSKSTSLEKALISKKILRP